MCSRSGVVEEKEEEEKEKALSRFLPLEDGKGGRVVGKWVGGSVA